ncbi:MAG TPA: two-component sensor histidine kinase, partial [Novosphingobium sp.]|nr:two-component sensor histidine kinase [Novosphingobium sp.]
MRVLARFWPRSLQGQVLLAVALALLFAQAISATLLWRAQTERREAALVHTAAMRLFAANRDDRFLGLPGEHPPEMIASARRLKVERSAATPLRDSDDRLGHDEEELREILASQGL